MAGYNAMTVDQYSLSHTDGNNDGYLGGLKMMKSRIFIIFLLMANGFAYAIYIEIYKLLFLSSVLFSCVIEFKPSHRNAGISIWRAPNSIFWNQLKQVHVGYFRI